MTFSCPSSDLPTSDLGVFILLSEGWEAREMVMDTEKVDGSGTMEEERHCRV